MVDADYSRRSRRVSLDIKISLDDIPPKGLKVMLRASEVELTELATWLDVPNIDMLSAEFDVTWEKDGEGVVISGPLKARLTQTCVVTLEPLETVIDAPTRVRYRHLPDDEDLDLEFAPDALERVMAKLKHSDGFWRVTRPDGFWRVTRQAFGAGRCGASRQTDNVAGGRQKPPCGRGIPVLGCVAPLARGPRHALRGAPVPGPEYPRQNASI